jgi:hypothetical protein
MTGSIRKMLYGRKGWGTRRIVESLLRVNYFDAVIKVGIALIHTPTVGRAASGNAEPEIILAHLGNRAISCHDRVRQMSDISLDSGID